MAKNKELTLEEKLKEALIPKEEQPYEIPESWEWVKLGSITKIKGGKRLPKGEEFSKEKTNNFYLRVTDFKERSINLENLKCVTDEVAQKIKNYRITVKDIYISIAGTIGKVGIIPKELNNSLLTENAAKITDILCADQIFLLNILEAAFIKRKIRESIVSSGQPKLALFRIEEFLIPLPPLEEQKRIVSKLDSMFEKINKAKELIQEVKENIENRKESILNKAFRGELTAEWRKNNQTEDTIELLKSINEEKIKNWEQECLEAEKNGKKKPSKPKIEEIQNMIISKEEEPYEIPKNWKWVRLEYITEINPKKKILNIDENEKMSFLPMKSISDVTGEILKIEYESYSKLKKGYTQFLENDILFAKITPCMENGKCAIAKNLKNEVGYGTTEFHVLRTTCVLNNEFLHNFLRRESFRQEAKYNMTGSVGFRRVPVEFLREYMFPLPPLKEQEEIVRILDEILEKESKIKELIELEEAIELLEKSILDKAFRGKLGTQNKDDETAIELLKKIL